MRLSMFAFGSWGDVRPLVVLGEGLRAAGHEVQMIASKGYEDWVLARGLDFFPLTDDVTQLFSDLYTSAYKTPVILDQFQMAIPTIAGN